MIDICVNPGPPIGYHMAETTCVFLIGYYIFPYMKRVSEEHGNCYKTTGKQWHYNLDGNERYAEECFTIKFTKDNQSAKDQIEGLVQITMLDFYTSHIRLGCF